MSNVRDFGAQGDGQADDTRAIRHTLRDGDGVLHFPRGEYIISEPIEIALDEVGRVGIDGAAGTAKVVMTGPGPAFRIVGTHEGTGSPNSAQPNVWISQRMPTVMNLEIEGRHDAADGIECIKTFQPTFEGVLIRRVRHGIRLHERNRNVLISHCHVYHNTGVGVFLDHVNLHQINIVGSHISYNRLGGIRIVGSEVRNLQITGNDIEYNNHRTHGTDPEPTAEIWVDTTAGGSVAEVTIASNTIQATASPGGANIRILGDLDKTHPPGLWTITGNIIGSQENNIHLTGCRGFSITGNFIYSCQNRNLLVENARQITIASNNFRRHTPSAGVGVRLVDSADCIIHGCHFKDEAEGGQESGASLLELTRCQRINITGCQLLDGVPHGIDLEQCDYVNLTGCTVMDTREEKQSQAAIRWTGEGRGNRLAANTLDEDIDIEDATGVRMD